MAPLYWASGAVVVVYGETPVYLESLIDFAGEQLELGKWAQKQERRSIIVKAHAWAWHEINGFRRSLSLHKVCVCCGVCSLYGCVCLSWLHCLRSNIPFQVKHTLFFRWCGRLLFSFPLLQSEDRAREGEGQEELAYCFLAVCIMDEVCRRGSISGSPMTRRWPAGVT